MLLAACSHPPWPPYDGAGMRVFDRLEQRSEMTESATYRVQWRSWGSRLHATFYLDIAYKAPDRFRVTADGPFGLPAFTSVIVGDTFWFVDHKAETLIVDQIQNLGSYEIPMADFFSNHWRELFSGGWGAGKTTRTLTLGVHPAEKRGRYETVWQSTRWIINWDHRREAPKWVKADMREEGERVLMTQTWFEHFREEYPFWDMRLIRITGLPEGGEHRWRVLQQEYNPAVPDRFFEPLSQPRRRPR
jgi:hypothetical protein